MKKKSNSKSSDDKRKEIITIKYTAEEKEKLRQKSEWDGQTIGEYMLQKSLKARNRKTKKDRERAMAMVELQQEINDVRHELKENNSNHITDNQLYRIQKGIDQLWES